MMTSFLDVGDLVGHIQAAYPDSVEEQTASHLWIKPDLIADVCRYLKEDPELKLEYLNSISAVDYIDHFELIYLMTSFEHNHSVFLRARVPGRGEPEVPSVIDIWPGADYQEREIWDLMGVRFEGHPNMKRILLWEGFPGHPLRKDFQDAVEY